MDGFAAQVAERLWAENPDYRDSELYFGLRREKLLVARPTSRKTNHRRRVGDSASRAKSGHNMTNVGWSAASSSRVNRAFA